MPIVYSVQSSYEPTSYFSSLTVASAAARDRTARSGEGGEKEAVVRMHQTPKANMDAILAALTGTGWASTETADVVKTFRNGRAVTR